MIRSSVASDSPLGGGPLRAGAGRPGRAARDRETGNTFHVCEVEIGDAVVVVDHESADHAVTLMGRRAVKIAPPSLTTVTSPPLRRATWRTRARPKPRRLRPGP